MINAKPEGTQMELRGVSEMMKSRLGQILEVKLIDKHERVAEALVRQGVLVLFKCLPHYSSHTCRI